MVEIFEFETYDSGRRRWEKARGMGTQAAIERRGGVAMRRSVLVVDDSRVDDSGMLIEHVAQKSGQGG